MKGHRFFIMVIAAALLGATTLAPRALARSDSRARPRKAEATKMMALPFEPTEQLIYEAEFSKLLLRGIKIAEFTFTSTRAGSGAPKQAGIPPTIGGRAQEDADKGLSPAGPHVASSPLLFVGELESKGWFRKLFGINFHFRVESTVEPESFAVLRTTKLDEQGKRVRTSEAVFDRAENKIDWIERDPNDPRRAPRIITNALDGAMYDIISAIYFLRTQPLTPGKTFDLVLSDSGQVYHVPASVSTEKKKMKGPLGKVTVVRVDVGLFGAQRPVAGEGQMSMWVTDDARRLPLRARISSNLGTLDISLKSVRTESR